MSKATNIWLLLRNQTYATANNWEGFNRISNAHFLMLTKVLAKLGQSHSGQPPETNWQIIHIFRSGLAEDKLERYQSFQGRQFYAKTYALVQAISCAIFQIGHFSYLQISALIQIYMIPIGNSYYCQWAWPGVIWNLKTFLQVTLFNLIRN